MFLNIKKENEIKKFINGLLENRKSWTVIYW